VGRDPAAIERTVCIGKEDLDRLDAYVEAGASHLILMSGHPFDFGDLETVLAAAES